MAYVYFLSFLTALAICAWIWVAVYEHNRSKHLETE